MSKQRDRDLSVCCPNCTREGDGVNVAAKFPYREFACTNPNCRVQIYKVVDDE